MQSQDFDRVGEIALPGRTGLTATQFVVRASCMIPKRPWLYGQHLLRGHLSMTVAPGGVGKSSLTVVQALELVSGKDLLGHWICGPLRVWLINLGDDRAELDRRIHAAMSHHHLIPDDVGARLFVDTGREQELILATQIRDTFVLNKAAVSDLENELRRRQIDVLIVDPFVSSHQVNEMDNGKIDMLAKTWIGLADRCNCAIELVHHTRKLNGSEATSDASRGASSLVNAARSSRVLQRLSQQEMTEAGVIGDGHTYFSVLRDKSNLAVAGERECYRTASVDLGQGDTVGVVERWKKPKLFDNLSRSDLIRVQSAIDGQSLRYSDQAADWVGNVIATTIGLDPQADRQRIKRLIASWLRSNALRKVQRTTGNGRMSPYVEVGDWAHE